MAKKQFAVGDRIRLTGQFLRNTGQFTGPEGQSRWTVTGISPAGMLVTDEPDDDAADWYSAEELAEHPYLRYRRIHPSNCEKVRK